MQHHRSFPISPLSKEELDAMRAVGRCERGFGALAHDAVRLGFLKAQTLGRIDADAALGLSALESDVLLGLAREPARDLGQLRTKAALFRSRQDEGDHTNLGAILFAALGADAARLGVSADDAGAFA